MVLLPRKRKYVKVHVSAFEKEFEYDLKKTTKGKSILEKVFTDVNLNERNYFGLSYIGRRGKEYWLPLNQKISSVKFENRQVYPLKFRVKFFPCDPANRLVEKEARNLFYLQLRHAVLTGKLTCPWEKAIKLASYACQIDFGDYNEDRFTAEAVELERVFSRKVLDECEQRPVAVIDRLVESYKEHEGMDKVEAMQNYLQIVKTLPNYGTESFAVQNKHGSPFILEVNEDGLSLQHFPNCDSEKQSHPWSQIRKIDFVGRKLIVQLRRGNKLGFTYLAPTVDVNRTIVEFCHGYNELYAHRGQPTEMTTIEKTAEEAPPYGELAVPGIGMEEEVETGVEADDGSCEIGVSAEADSNSVEGFVVLTHYPAEE